MSSAPSAGCEPGSHERTDDRRIASKTHVHVPDPARGVREIARVVIDVVDSWWCARVDGQLGSVA